MEIYIDDNRIKFVQAIEINMSAGSLPTVRLEIVCTTGLEADIECALVNLKCNR